MGEGRQHIQIIIPFLTDQTEPFAVPVRENPSVKLHGIFIQGYQNNALIAVEEAEIQASLILIGMFIIGPDLFQNADTIAVRIQYGKNGIVRADPGSQPKGIGSLRKGKIREFQLMFQIEPGDMKDLAVSVFWADPHL